MFLNFIGPLKSENAFELYDVVKGFCYYILPPNGSFDIAHKIT